MSISVIIGRMQSGRIAQAFSRIGGNIESSSDRLADDMIVRWNQYTRDGWPVGPDREGHTHSRDTIEVPRKIANGHYQFRITAPYAGVIEYGGYRGVGPKTAPGGGDALPGNVNINRGIYPIQRPSAPLRRAQSRINLEMSQTATTQLLRRGSR